jgi:hypothetical protein
VERRALLAGTLLTVAALALPAEAAIVAMSVDQQGCGGYTSGTGTCEVVPGSELSVTWALEAQETLNGYQLQIRWDPSELSLIRAVQLFPDTAPPVAWTVEPSDPNASVASAFRLPTPADTTLLFRLDFLAIPSGNDAKQDLWWFPQGAGLTPGSVALDNPAGAGIDFTAVPIAVPSLSRWGSALLALALVALAAGVRPRVRRRVRASRSAAACRPVRRR